MKVTHSFRAPRIDVDQYRTALDRHMKEVLAQGLMEWLDARCLEIPNWSGASRATFWRLAETINAQVDASGPRVGIGQLAGDGSMQTDKMKGVYTFTYTRRCRGWSGTSTTTPTWTRTRRSIRRRPSLKKPGPYHFQAQAAFAFMRFADTVRLPPSPLT